MLQNVPEDNYSKICSRVPFGDVHLIDLPFRRAAVDLIGLISPVGEKGGRCISTSVDYAIKCPEAVPLVGIETKTVAED